MIALLHSSLTRKSRCPLILFLFWSRVLAMDDTKDDALTCHPEA